MRTEAPNYESMLIALFQKEKSDDPIMDEDDDRYEEDSEEIKEVRNLLGKNYDKALEDAAQSGFKCSLATAAGKRYLLFKNRCAAEQQAYSNADEAGKKKLISDWIRKQFDTYQDSS